MNKNIYALCEIVALLDNEKAFNIMGIYSTRALAQKALARCRKTQPISRTPGDTTYYIAERELDWMGWIRPTP